MKNLLATTVLALSALISLSDGAVQNTLRQQQKQATTTLDLSKIPSRYHRHLEDESDLPVLGCILSDDPLGCVLTDIFGDEGDSDTVIGCLTDGENLLDIGCYLQAVLGAEEGADDLVGQTINCIDENLFDLACYLDAFLGGVIEDDDGLLGGFSNCLLEDTFNLGCYLDAIIGSNTDDSTEGLASCFDLENVFDIGCYLDNIFGTGNGEIEELGDVNATQVVDVASGLLACADDMSMECAATALLGHGVTENSELTKCILMNATTECFTDAVLGTSTTEEVIDGTSISLEDIKDMILSGEIDITVPGSEVDSTETSEETESSGSSLWDVIGGFF